jgi:HSP20 family protein
MALVKWNPWTELESFRHDFDRFFDTYMPRVFGYDSWNRQQALWMPRMDVRETDSAYIVEADLPGMSIEDIAVHVEGNTLVLAGERKGEQTNNGRSYAHFERTFGKFKRAFTLPTAVKVDEVHATYAGGVLTVTVPKAEAARTKRIAITSA